MTPTQAPVLVTSANLPRWRAGLTLLSLDRGTPLWAELGLPERMTAEPARLRTVAEAAVRALHHTTGKSCGESSAAEARRILSETFGSLFGEYDPAAADQLGNWLVRYVVSEPSRMAFAAWRELLRRLCCLVAPDNLTVPTTLNSGTMLRICQAVHGQFAPESLAVFRHLLSQARSLPETPWEEWLERETRREAGGHHHLGAVAQALDLAQGIAADERTARAWQNLQATTSVAARATLHRWAGRQASALGLPFGVLDHEPFRETPEQSPTSPAT